MRAELSESGKIPAGVYYGGVLPHHTHFFPQLPPSALAQEGCEQQRS